VLVLSVSKKNRLSVEMLGLVIEDLSFFFTDT
jgi:hypothetical protein